VARVAQMNRREAARRAGEAAAWSPDDRNRALLAKPATHGAPPSMRA
jgi:hypothetical protein